MAEALNEIVQIMTEPRYMNKMVVVMAGYEAQVDELMAVNPGLKSRFSEKLHFPDFGCADACKMFGMEVAQNGLDLTEEADIALPSLMEKVSLAKL